MSSFAQKSSASRIKEYTGDIPISRRESERRAVRDAELEELENEYYNLSADDDELYHNHYQNPTEENPKNSKLCYVMGGGGIGLKADITTSAGKQRLKEYDKINSENLLTHDRISNIQSTINHPQKKSSKPRDMSKVLAEGKERSKIAAGRQIALQNAKMKKALNGIYKGEARLKEHGVKRLDCRKIWSKRTDLYDVEKAFLSKHSNTGVPKTASMVSCGGCGLKSFFGADGLNVSPGFHGNLDGAASVFYCNDVCAAVDWEINRENLNAQNAGMKPLRKASYWIQSRAAIVARKMLQSSVKKGELPNLDLIMHEIKVQRNVGARQNISIAKKLPGAKEEDAVEFLTGTEKGKRHIIRGREHVEKFEAFPEPDVWLGKELPNHRQAGMTVKQQKEREVYNRYQYDKSEIERLVREGSTGGRGTADKNVQSVAAEIKEPKTSKYKNASKVSLTDDDKYGSKTEMYKTSRDLQTEKDAAAAKVHAKGQKIANQGKRKEAKVAKEASAYETAEKERVDGEARDFNIKRISHLPKPAAKRVEFREKPATFNGLEYDATKNKRKEERKIEEPITNSTLPDEDPALFRQTRDMYTLKQ